MHYKMVLLMMSWCVGFSAVYAAHAPDHAGAVVADADASLQCQLCLEPIEHRVEAIWLPCGHVFHREHCLRGWVAGTDRTPPHNTCPYCRGTIVRGDVPLGGAALIAAFFPPEVGAPMLVPHPVVPIVPAHPVAPIAPVYHPLHHDDPAPYMAPHPMPPMVLRQPAWAERMSDFFSHAGRAAFWLGSVAGLIYLTRWAYTDLPNHLLSSQWHLRDTFGAGTIAGVIVAKSMADAHDIVDNHGLSLLVYGIPIYGGSAIASGIGAVCSSTRLFRAHAPEAVTNIVSSGPVFLSGNGFGIMLYLGTRWGIQHLCDMFDSLMPR